MVNNLTDDTLKFLIEQVSIIKQQNKWQSEHLAEVYSYTRKINGKVIELEKHRQQQLIEKEIKDQIKEKSILNKKTFWPVVWTLGLFFYPLYISLFLEVGPTNVADFFVVKADTATDGALVAADFDAITGWNNSADNSSNVTKYSSEVTTWSTTGYNNIALNSTALADMGNNGVVKFCLIESTKDLTNTAPTSEISSGIYFQESSGTSFDPILRYTAAATGYANDVIGVSSANIAKVNGVTTANIDKVIGV